MKSKLEKIVCTAAPQGSFGGRDYLGSKILIDTLKGMGFDLYILDTTCFFQQNTLEIHRIFKELRQFDPKFAFSFPNAGYGLGCSVFENGKYKNFFTEVLEIPLALCWDDPLGQFSMQILSPLPVTPSQSEHGALEKIKAVINHPLMFHFAWDTGHIKAMINIGLLSEDKIRFHLLGSPQQYVEYGKKTGIFTSSYTHDVCFVGNIYLNQVKNNPLSQFDIIKNIAQKVADKKIADFSNHAWDLLLAEIQEIPTKTREIFKLKLDESFFWNAYIYIIWIGVNTYVRMKVLSSIEEVAFYGGFADPYGINELYSFKNINYMNSVDYLVDLPRIFNTTKITVDVTNQLVHNSAPGKFFECFSAGGFMLIDYSKDIIKAFGEKAKLISYKTINELNAKIEYYLSHDRERQEITRFFQNEINTNYTTKKWLSFITSDLKMRIERTGQSERR